MIGKTVTTPYGIGTVKRRKASEGALSRRCLVELLNSQSLPGNLPALHAHQGGLWFRESELKMIQSQGDLKCPE